jgi:neural cell adhesion molecule
VSQTYSVDRGEIANIKCEVESNPNAHDFKWRFNTSLLELQPTELHGTNDEAKNVLNFKPQSENDYGTVLCWGINSIGMQTEPCAFQVVPAGKPEPLTNCSVVNQTQFSFQVVCVEGYDGGFPVSTTMRCFFE